MGIECGSWGGVDQGLSWKQTLIVWYLCGDQVGSLGDNWLWFEQGVNRNFVVIGLYQVDIGLGL